MAKRLSHCLPQFPHAATWQFQLLRNWNSIVGNLNTKITLEKIHNDTLVIGVYDACWMQELYLLSALLIDTINQNLDYPRIKHLRFKRAVLKKPTASLAPEPPPIITPRPLTAQEKKALATVQDDQLRAALEQFLFRCHKEKK